MNLAFSKGKCTTAKQCWGALNEEFDFYLFSNSLFFIFYLVQSLWGCVGILRFISGSAPLT